MINFIEVPLKGKNKTLVKISGLVNTGRPLQVKYWGVATPLAPAALKPMIIIILTPVFNSQGMEKIRYALQKSTKIELK